VDDPDLESVTMHYSDLMSVVDGGMKSPDEEQEHVARGVQIQHLDDTYSVDVPATTLEALLDDLPDIDTIDFFSLDVEGFELNVLRGMNPDRYRPKLILVEARYFDEVDAFLTSNDYEHVKQMSRLDHLYRDARLSQ